APGEVSQRDLFAVSAGQAEAGGLLAQAQAIAPQAAGRGRLELFELPFQDAQGPQCSEQEEAQEQDRQPQGDGGDQQKRAHGNWLLGKTFVVRSVSNTMTVVPSFALQRTERNLFTPKGFHNTAQGKRSAALSQGASNKPNPEGVA